MKAIEFVNSGTLHLELHLPASSVKPGVFIMHNIHTGMLINTLALINAEIAVSGWAFTLSVVDRDRIARPISSRCCSDAAELL
jgi:hypothetical protein